MNATRLLEKYFPDPASMSVVLDHSRMVAEKALCVACSLSAKVDLKFIEEAALIHDIGICRTASAKLGCYGEDPYIRHGVIGREILENENFPRHALLCERHIGVGLTAADVREQRLPLPEKDMFPLSLEEKLVCFADLFYSKKAGEIRREKSIEEIKNDLRKFGPHKVQIFDEWRKEFNVP
jgi:uncharacterized protein